MTGGSGSTEHAQADRLDLRLDLSRLGECRDGLEAVRTGDARGYHRGGCAGRPLIGP